MKLWRLFRYWEMLLSSWPLHLLGGGDYEGDLKVPISSTDEQLLLTWKDGIPKGMAREVWNVPFLSGSEWVWCCFCAQISLQSERGCTGRFLIQPATRIWTFLLPWWFCFCFFFKPLVVFFPSWVTTKKSDSEELNSSDCSYWKEKFLSGTSLPKMLIRDTGLG